MRFRCGLALVLVLVGTLACPGSEAAGGAAPQTVAELKAARLKSLIRREPRARELVEKVGEKVRAAYEKAETPEANSAPRLERTLYQIIMSSGSLSEDRLRDAVDLLADMAGPFKPLPAADLVPLQERYSKVCAALDDQIFIRDLEMPLNLHDRFIQRAALGLWDKSQMEAELEKIEQSLKKAPELPYGRSELLRNLQGKRLVAASRGCYIGVFSEQIFCGEESMISGNRPSLGIIAEGTGADLLLDSADFAIQDAGGELVNLDSANRARVGAPFCPPLSLWMKSKLLEGHIPVISFNLATAEESRSESTYSPCYGTAAKSKAAPSANRPPLKCDPSNLMSVADVLSGKLDEYFTHNFKMIAETKAPIMIGLFNMFDQAAVDSAFGADGKTPYYMLIDPKLAKLPADKRRQEVEHRLAKGGFLKDIGAELRKHYGDPSLPDGPERVRDAWKHVRGLATAAGATSSSFFSCAGAFHGDRKGLSLSPMAGAQEWNKLEAYWPGEGVLDWLGISGVWADTEKSKGSSAIADCIGEFMIEARNSNWHATPIMVRDLAPAREDPIAEEKWISGCFQGLLPESYPEIKAFFVRFPEQLTLWSPDGLSAFRRGVSSNPYYKMRLRLAPVSQQQASTPH